MTKPSRLHKIHETFSRVCLPVHSTIHLLPAFLTMIIPWILYASVLQSWWRWDDPVLLSFAASNSILAPLFFPEVWQSLTPFNFTPLVFLSLKLDLYLFKDEPSLFYARQLLALSGICFLTYVLVRRWVSGVWAFWCVVLFCLGPVVLTVANQLMSRHYLEGLFFTILAFFLFTQSLDKKKLWIAATGALFFFIALTAKEIFFSLALLVLLWPADMKFSDRLKCGVFFLVPLVVFYFWRSYMLGGAVDGYGIDFSVLHDPFNFMDIILSALLGGTTINYLLWFLACLPAVWLCFRKGRFLSVVIIAGALVAPLVVVVSVVSGPDRFFLLMWWALCMFVAVGIGRLEGGILLKLTKSVLALILLGVTFSYAQVQKDKIDYHASLFDTTGRFVWHHHSSDDILYVPQAGSNDWFFWGLTDLKKKVSPEHGSILRVMSDPVELIEIDLEDNIQVWEYDSGTGSISRIIDLEESIISEFQRSLADFSFEVDMRFADGFLSWSFSSDFRGTYFILYRFRENVTGIQPLPSAGTLRMPLSRDLQFRIKLETKDGMVSYSPWATLYHDRENSISWKVES